MYRAVSPPDLDDRRVEIDFVRRVVKDFTRDSRGSGDFNPEAVDDPDAREFILPVLLLVSKLKFDAEGSRSMNRNFFDNAFRMGSNPFSNASNSWSNLTVSVASTLRSRVTNERMDSQADVLASRAVNLAPGWVQM